MSNSADSSEPVDPLYLAPPFAHKSTGPSKAVCGSCNREFFTRDREMIYCSLSCAEGMDDPRALAMMKKAHKKNTLRKAQIEITNSFGLDTDLWMSTEKEFAEWFRHHYWFFGLRKILAMGTSFPDVLGELPTGEPIRVELEYHAANFKLHGHDPDGADLICSYANSGLPRVLGVPVLALFDIPQKSRADECDFSDLKPTPFFKEVRTKIETTANEYYYAASEPYVRKK